MSFRRLRQGQWSKYALLLINTWPSWGVMVLWKPSRDWSLKCFFFFVRFPHKLNTLKDAKHSKLHGFSLSIHQNKGQSIISWTIYKTLCTRSLEFFCIFLEYWIFGFPPSVQDFYLFIKCNFKHPSLRLFRFQIDQFVPFLADF